MACHLFGANYLNQWWHISNQTLHKNFNKMSIEIQIFSLIQCIMYLNMLPWPQCVNRHTPGLFMVIIPPLHRRWEGGILDSPWCLSVRLSVRPSVRPSVGKVSATFRENYWLNSFHPWDLYLWGKSLDPYRFSCSCPHFWPSGGQKLTENRGFRNFSQKLSARFISSLGFILMG